MTASNSAGSAGPVNSKPTAVITPATKPALATRPTIIGKPVVGQQLVAQTGTYSGGAVSGYGYQWERCDAGTLDVLVDLGRHQAGLPGRLGGSRARGCASR